MRLSNQSHIYMKLKLFFLFKCWKLTWQIVGFVLRLHSIAFELVAIQQSNCEMKKKMPINYFNVIISETRTNTQISMTIQFTWFHGTNTVRVIGWNGERWNCNVTAPPPLTRTSNLYGKQRKKKKIRSIWCKMERKKNVTKNREFFRLL